ncbi:penicillin-binding protein activator LpoB [Leptospira idonii]|uniref:Penicillin-binding protein activator LpoB n=1 Tax=Leptospira idonii TaxID=1193500 RepID=A0A4R9M0K4_9LEPT|nr:penicillin-binding protein activator LpoB [Leptospira idonii]TGN20193.1 penicillin-binding protein activator LpoB [Leptospira idonii]
MDRVRSQKWKKVQAVLACIVWIHCSGVSYKDPETASGTKQWGAKEVKDTVSEMTDSLALYYRNELKSGYLEWKRFENNTSEHIDTRILGNEISTNLTKRKIPFIDTSLREDASLEISFGKTGMVSSDSRLNAGNMKSPSHRLKGELNDIVNYEDGRKIQYIVVTLALVRMETGEIVWQEQKKFLKVSKVEGYGL